MTTLKQRHKQELKALNLECEKRLAGKKGSEREAEMEVVAKLKLEMGARHEAEVAEEAAKATEAATQGATETAPTAGTEAQPKISRARQRELKKEAKELEEKKKRETENASRGPTPRELEMRVLEDELRGIGLQVKEIAPDGNCLYGAVSHQLSTIEGKTMNVAELRQLAYDTMKSNPAMFTPFFPEGESLESYGAKVKQMGEWGGELEIRAISLGLGRQIWVHRINTPTVKMGADQGYDPSKIYHLTFHEHQFALGEHYNSAAPKGAESH